MRAIGKEKKKRFVNPLSLAGVESKKTKAIVMLMGVFFFMFFITAFVNTARGVNSIHWWILSGLCAMVAIAIAIFSKK